MPIIVNNRSYDLAYDQQGNETTTDVLTFKKITLLTK